MTLEQRVMNLIEVVSGWALEISVSEADTDRNDIVDYLIGQFKEEIFIERERCARLAETFADPVKFTDLSRYQDRLLAREIARAIRG